MKNVHFSLLNNLKDIYCGHVNKIVTLSIINWRMYICKTWLKIVGIHMGTNCAPLVADLFLFCYEKVFMLSISDNNQADVVEAFKSISRYLDDLLNIDK